MFMARHSRDSPKINACLSRNGTAGFVSSTYCEVSGTFNEPIKANGSIQLPLTRFGRICVRHKKFQVSWHGSRVETASERELSRSFHKFRRFPQRAAPKTRHRDSGNHERSRRARSLSLFLSLSLSLSLSLLIKRHYSWSLLLIPSARRFRGPRFRRGTASQTRARCFPAGRDLFEAASRRGGAAGRASLYLIPGCTYSSPGW